MPPIGGPSSLYQRDLMSRPVFNTRNCSKVVRGRSQIQKVHVMCNYIILELVWLLFWILFYRTTKRKLLIIL